MVWSKSQRYTDSLQPGNRQVHHRRAGRSLLGRGAPWVIARTGQPIRPSCPAPTGDFGRQRGIKLGPGLSVLDQAGAGHDRVHQAIRNRAGRRIPRPPAAAARATPWRSSADARPPPTTRSAPRPPPRPPHPNCPGTTARARPTRQPPARLQHIGDRAQPPGARGVLHPRPRPHRTGTTRPGQQQSQLFEHIFDNTQPNRHRARSTAPPVDEFAPGDNSASSTRPREARRRRKPARASPRSRDLGAASGHRRH